MPITKLFNQEVPIEYNVIFNEQTLSLDWSTSNTFSDFSNLLPSDTENLIIMMVIILAGASDAQVSMGWDKGRLTLGATANDQYSTTLGQVFVLPYASNPVFSDSNLSKAQVYIRHAKRNYLFGNTPTASGGALTNTQSSTDGMVDSNYTQVFVNAAQDLYLKYDLGEVRTGEFCVRVDFDATSGNSDYYVEYSDDDVSYTTLATGSLIGGIVDIQKRYTVPGARYLRLRIDYLGGGAYNKYIKAYEACWYNTS